MDVFIDTNIIGDDYFLRGTKFQALDAYLGKTQSSLIISDITRQEISKHFYEGLQKLENIEKEAYKYSKNKELIKVKINRELISRNFDLFWSDLSHFKIVKPKIDENFYNILTLKAIKRLKPFKENGSGLQDAIIWLCYTEILKASKRTIAFISNNSKDFGKGSLDKFLDLEVNKNKFRYYNSLEEFLSELSQPISFISEEFIKKFLDSKKDILFYSVKKEDLLTLNKLERIQLQVNEQISLEQIEIINIEDPEQAYFFIYNSDSNFYYLQIVAGFDIRMAVHLNDFDNSIEPAQIFLHKSINCLVDKKSKQIVKWVIHSDSFIDPNKVIL